MARAPRASVSKSSGQGVSRYSYQKGRQLGNKGSGAAGDTSIDTKFGGGSAKSTGGGHSYAKGNKTASDINVSYGGTITPSDIEDVKALGAMKIDKQKPLGPTKSKQLK